MLCNVHWRFGIYLYNSKFVGIRTWIDIEANIIS